jgi:hypothetical protein
MATNYTSDTLKTYAINTFKNTFAVPNDLNIGLVFIGRSNEFANGANQIKNIDKDERTIWDNMICLLEIQPGDVELVIPKKTWITNVKYKQYDDTIRISQLITADSANTIAPFYVYNSEGNVYKCLSNNNSALSTVEPTGSPLDGFVSTADGYTWKYMYNVPDTSRFLANNWIPVPFSIDVASVASEYSTNLSSLSVGTINVVVVEQSGSGYYHKVHDHGYSNNISYLTVTDFSNVAIGMYVVGNGITSGTHITSIDELLNRIYISSPTSNTGTSYTTTTRVVLEGDGQGATADAELVDDYIDKIDIVTWGLNYSYANVIIYGTSNSASARAVVSSKQGHGYSPALELYSKDLLIVRDIGSEGDSTEGGIIPDDITYRQYGIIMNPHKYGSNVDLTYSLANSAISQTLDVTVTAGTDYTQNEFVYQGSSLSSSTFKGLVVSQSNNIIRLSNTTGILQIGAVLKGSTVSRPVISYANTSLQRYTGDILYVNNVDGIERAPEQIEELKFIINF